MMLGMVLSFDLVASHGKAGWVLTSRNIWGPPELGGGWKIKFTLPETNMAGWKIHHFNGIYQERWGFSWAMLVSGRVKKNPLKPPLAVAQLL